MGAKFDTFLGRVREWAVKSTDISDSGAAGRQLLQKDTLPEIQSLVSGGGITNLEKLRLAVSLGRQDYIYSVPAVAPVMTFSAGDTPTVVSPKYIEYGDAAWTSSVRMVLGTGYPNGNVAFSQYLSDGAISAAPLNSSLNSSVFLTTDCPAPELRMKTFSGSFSVWYVEGGRRYFAGSVTSIPDNALHYLKIDFGGSRVLRTIEVEANQVGRWAIGANDSYYPAATNPLKVIIVGDSFTEGTGLSGVPMSYGWAPTFAKLCGIQLAQISALGGTGYSATNGSRVNLLQRLQSDVIDFAPDVVVHANGINDTLGGVTTNAPLVFDAISTALPNCQQVVFPAFRPRSITTVDPINELLSSLCATRDKMLYVPCQNEIWGTGYGGTGTGNSSWVIGGTDGTDSTHPTNAGHRYLGRARRDFLAAALGL
jgi:lysophospholipase L1-like esterase